VTSVAGTSTLTSVTGESRGPSSRGVLGRLAARAAAETVNGWLAPGLTLVYAVASVLIAFVGLSAGGTIQAQDFGRTAISLLAVTLWIVPLAAALSGALALSDDGELSLLLVQPVSWRVIFLGRWLGATVATVAGVLLGWGATGILVGGLAGWSDLGGYLGVGAVAVGAAVMGTAVGATAAAVGGRRAPAIITALALWFALAVAYDLCAIAAISVVSSLSGAAWTPAFLAALNPFDALRVLGTVAIGGRELAFGAVTASLAQSGTARLPLVMLTSVGVWTAGALWIGARVFERRDR